MSNFGELPSRESVLDAFAAENDYGRATLERYLRLYPVYANDLVDLSLELSCAACEDVDPLSPSDQSLIDAAWVKHAAAAPKAFADPFKAMAISDWRVVAQRLDVPRQVVTALREGRVALASIPRRFLQKWAEAMSSTISQLELALEKASPCGARSYKAEGKPVAGGQVSFEQVLIDAGVPAEKLVRLLGEMD